MSVDPADQCTFWYTNEYIPDSGGLWQTRIATMKFLDNCTDTPIVPDTESPFCQLISSDPGPPPSIQATVQDLGGLGQVRVLNAVNVTVTVDPFDAGTTDPVGFTVTVIDDAQPAEVGIGAIDIAGNTQICGTL